MNYGKSISMYVCFTPNLFLSKVFPKHIIAGRLQTDKSDVLYGRVDWIGDLI